MRRPGPRARRFGLRWLPFFAAAWAGLAAACAGPAAEPDAHPPGDPRTGIDAGAAAEPESGPAAGSVGLLEFASGAGTVPATPADRPYLVVLGVGQDGGHPQAGMTDDVAWQTARRRHATSLALVDPATGERWLFEATPDFREQLRALDRTAPAADTPGLAGIFLTHAHVGHYAGLLHLGREVIGARRVPVHAMPRMRAFLAANGPWDQLVRLGNIDIRALEADRPVRLNERLAVTPFLVPHRDEYSETVGYRIDGPDRSVLFIPDIDKWERWDQWGRRIEEVVAGVDVAYLDATFFEDGEVPGRAIAEIPHPFVVETIARFARRPAEERDRIRLIHINRTNPILWADSEARRRVEAAGMRVAAELEILPL